MGLGTLKTAKKFSIFLLAVLLIFLAVSFLPFGNDDSQDKITKEKSILLEQLDELNSLPQAVDEKIAPAVKDMVAEALYLSATAKDEKKSEERMKIEFIVKSSDSISGEVRKAGGRVVDNVRSIDGKSEYSVVEADADKVVELAAEGSVVRIIPNAVFYATLDESVPLVKAASFWNAGYTGSGVKVAVVDTGIDKNSPILQGKVVAEKDFTNTGNTDDLCGHGTHVAGIIGGMKANGGSYDGVAPGAQLISVKALTKQSDGSCGGKLVGILEGMKWAIDPDANPATDDGAKVISMSLGGAADISSFTDFDNELKAIVDKGVVIVVSSGNCGSGCPDFISCGSFRSVTYPGSSSHVISVGAVDKSKNVACFSSGGVVAGVGIKPDFAAPGVGIKSSVPGGSYAAKSGTSMAAPHVSGAVALMLSKSPQLKQDDVKRILEKTALDLGDIGKDTSYGFGLIDLSKAMIYKEGLEFTVGLEGQVISGSTQRIVVTIFDDISISSVTGTVTKPSGVKSAEITFTSIGSNVYAYDYTDTELMGNYVVDISISYGGATGSSGAGSEGGGEAGSGSGDVPSVTAIGRASFKVTSLTGDFGNVEEISISQQQKLSSNLTGTLTFANTAGVELNFSALLQLLDNLTVVQEIRPQPVTVAANSKAAVSVNNALEVGPGSYTLKILTDYGAGSLMNETNITVADDLAPQVVKVGYSKTLKVNDAQVITVEVNEHQKVQAELEVSQVTETAQGTLIEPIIANHTVKLLSEIGNRKTIAITIFNGSNLIGEEELDEGDGYVVTLRLCDPSGNCYGKLGSGKKEAEFSIIDCSGKSVLVVKTYDRTSLFEEAASATGNVCLSVINKSVSGTPPASYLERFGAVVWSTGTDLVNIDGNDAAALSDYYSKKGKVIVEGSDVAFRHGSDVFMGSVLHAQLKNDLGFTVTSVDNMSNLSINITRPHPVVYGLAPQLPFNATVDPFPDAVAAANGGVELAAWGGLDTAGAAMVAYESDTGNFKSLFLPFSIEALDDGAAESLAAGSLAWLFDEASGDMRPAGLSHGFLVEGQIAATVMIQSSEQLQAAPIINVFAGEVLVSSGALDITSQSSSEPWEYAYPFEATLDAGQHSITVVANSGFPTGERNYVNNVAEYALKIYPELPDLVFSGLAYSYDNAKGAITANISASNFGGAAAVSSVKVYLDGKEAAQQGIGFGAGETKQLALEMPSEKGAYLFKAVIDPDSAVAEHNESNNEMQQKIYLCSKEKILVVDDNDAEFFSTPEPGSSDEFLRVLMDGGYCVEGWDEKEKGEPSPAFIAGFPVVVWSAGDYFNGTISSEDALAISNYAGSLLLEGSDLGLDHSSGEFFQELTSTSFSSDMMLNETENESLLLKGHPITDGIGGISISREKSPYPDGAEVVGESAEAVAEWQSGNAAITANSDGRKTAYYAFSIDGVTEEATMEMLVLNTVAWLLEKPNSPPLIQTLSAGASMEVSTEAIKVTMSEGQTRNFSVIATDPDGDPLTFMWLLNGTLVSGKYYFAFLPKYNESGSYNLTVIVSDGQAEARAEMLITVLDVNRPAMIKGVHISQPFKKKK